MLTFYRSGAKILLSNATNERTQALTDYTKNFGFKHKCGILMPMSALPSDFGIGSFGKEAYDFIDFLSATGQKCWQVLPLNPTSYGDSPYQSPASVAGSPYYIDLPTLRAEGLITREELKSARVSGKRVDYGRLFVERIALLRCAYGRFSPNGDFKTFCRRNKDWLYDYALFMALKVHYSYRPWTEWREEHRDCRRARLCAGDFEAECGFWMWVQYVFAEQWLTVLNYAHSKGITVIGDMPIYVAHDSMDVWCAPEQFLLDDEYLPTRVAGCPPDAYAEDGQLWGNPIYNWERMTEDDFSWWIARVKQSFKLYDILRIDHFRGFAGYYSIPYGEPTAKNGEWRAAPGKELFDAIRAAFPRAKIIAEDLGFITDDVRELLAYTGFPGMKLLQFAFYDDNSEYQPHTYTTANCVVYSASHDSDCTRSWYKSLSKDARVRFRRECSPKVGQSPTYALINAAMGSIANLAIIPMQDYLELTNERGRMNIPSEPSGNWQWRLGRNYDTAPLRERVLAVAKKNRRASRIK